MNDYWYQNFEWIITIIITIVGFIYSSRNITRNFKNEVIKLKNEVAISAMQDIPYELFDLMEEMQKKTEKTRISDRTQKKYVEIIAKILCYGSRESVDIVRYLQQNNYNQFPEASEQ